MKLLLLCVLIVIPFILVGCSSQTTSTPSVPVPSYTELGSHMLNDCLVIEVSTTSQDESSRNTITDDVMAKHNWEKMVRVFFYLPGQTVGVDTPQHHIERNAFDGNNQSY